MLGVSPLDHGHARPFADVLQQARAEAQLAAEQAAGKTPAAQGLPIAPAKPNSMSDATLTAVTPTRASPLVRVVTQVGRSMAKAVGAYKKVSML